MLLHMDPVRVGVCEPRSIHCIELDRLTLRFCAQSMMQGLPGGPKMMGGLTSVTTAWSKDRPTDSSDTDGSEITCRDKTFILEHVGFVED